MSPQTVVGSWRRESAMTLERPAAEAATCSAAADAFASASATAAFADADCEAASASVEGSGPLSRPALSAAAAARMANTAASSASASAAVATSPSSAKATAHGDRWPPAARALSLANASAAVAPSPRAAAAHPRRSNTLASTEGDAARRGTSAGSGRAGERRPADSAARIWRNKSPGDITPTSVPGPSRRCCPSSVPGPSLFPSSDAGSAGIGTAEPGRRIGPLNDDETAPSAPTQLCPPRALPTDDAT